MKRVFLLIAVPALLVALGFAQTPPAGGNTDQINIQGCLGSSDGNYTVAEDNTGKTFKITTSSADMKPHLGHEVKLIGYKSGAAENSLAVTELSMISEHCTVAAVAPAAAPAATVTTPPETVITPAADAGAPAAAPAPTVTKPSETVTTPAADAAAPAAVPAATVTIPAAAAVAPAAVARAEAVSAPSETVAKPATPAAVRPTRPSAQAKPPATPVPEAAPAETVSAPAAAVTTPAVPDSPPSETVDTLAAATTPTPAASGWSSWVLIPFAVLAIILGTLVPLINRWRKRKLLEQANSQNLSFTHETSAGQDKSDKPVAPKAA